MVPRWSEAHDSTCWITDRGVHDVLQSVGAVTDRICDPLSQCSVSTDHKDRDAHFFTSSSLPVESPKLDATVSRDALGGGGAGQDAVELLRREVRALRMQVVELREQDEVKEQHLLRLLQRHHQQTQEMVAQRLFEQQHGCYLREMLCGQIACASELDMSRGIERNRETERDRKGGGERFRRHVWRERGRGGEGGREGGGLASTETLCVLEA